jgi:hypothetical protein
VISLEIDVAVLVSVIGSFPLRIPMYSSVVTFCPCNFDDLCGKFDPYLSFALKGVPWSFTHVTIALG